MAVTKKAQITDETLQLAVLALRIERGSSSGPKSRSGKAPAKQMTDDDL